MSLGERGVFAFRDGELVRIKEPKKIARAPMVMTDEMEPMESYATHEKRVFDSKSAYRRHLKEHGFKETGGEHLKDSMRVQTKTASDSERERAYDKEMVEKAYMDVKYGRVPFTEKEKQNHINEERKWGKNYKVTSPI